MKLTLLLLILLSNICLGAVRLDFAIKGTTIRQGSIIEALLAVDPEAIQKNAVLRGQTLAGTIYIQDLSPFMRRNDSFEAAAKIIFVKMPETQPLQHKENGVEAIVSWTPVEIVPTDAPKEFLFGEFDVPPKRKIFLYVGLTFLFITILLLGRRFYLSFRNKNQLKKKKRALRDEIFSVSTYEDVVSIWKRKAELIVEFPHLAPAFKKLEATLFKVQFKPAQTKAEKEQVLDAFSVFKSETERGFDGI